MTDAKTNWRRQRWESALGGIRGVCPNCFPELTGPAVEELLCAVCGQCWECCSAAKNYRHTGRLSKYQQ